MVSARALVRVVGNWRRGVRNLGVVILAVVMSVGAVVLTPTKAFAVVPEVRTPLAAGLDTSWPLVAFGTNMLFGTHRSTNSGGTWLTDATLSQMVGVTGRWRSAANGKLVGVLSSGTAYSAVVYTLASGDKQVYPLSGYTEELSDTWALPNPYGALITAFNYTVANSAPVTVSSPSGATLSEIPWARIGPASTVLWHGSTTDHTLYATATSPAAAPSAWVTIDGVTSSAMSSTQFLYAVDTVAGPQFCARPLASLASAPVCVTLPGVVTGHYYAAIYTSQTSTILVVNDYQSASSGTKAYILTGGSLMPLQLPSGSNVQQLDCAGGSQCGDTPYVMVRDSNSVASVKKVNADGSLGAVVPLPPAAAATATLLGIAPDRVVEADDRDGSAGTNPVWSRSVSSSGFGAETVLPRRASELRTSAGRTVLSGPEGYSIYDRGSLVSTLTPGRELGTFSGPYISRWNYDPVTGTPSAVVSMVDGTQVATFDTGNGVLSGSRFISVAEDTDVAGSYRLVVNDLTGKDAARTVDLPAGTAACYSWILVADSIFLTCAADFQVYSVATGQLTRSVPRSNGSSYIQDVGDGYMITYVYGTEGRAFTIVDLASGAATPLEGCADLVVSDDVGHVVCTSDSEMIWRDFSSLSPSAGRVLGWLAPSTFASGSWTPEIDATKPFSAGVLRISNGATVVRELTVPASADGSVRGVSWDGKNAAGVLAASGTYTATLVVSGKDGSGAVKAVDGTSAPAVDVAWTGGTVVAGAPGSFAALSPSRLLDTRDGTGATAAGPVAANGVIDLQVTGRGGVPASGVGAVILNVTAVTPTGPGFLSVYPAGGAVPNASNLNFTPGQVVPNLVVAKAGTGGKVSIKNSSPGVTHVVADVAGFFADGTVGEPGGLTAVSPSRLLDTRDSAAVASGGSVVIQATGRGGVPASGVSSVVVNLTAVTPTASGFLTAYPSGGAVPNASNVNFTAGQVVPNLAFVKLSADGSFTVKNTSPGVTHVVADVAGYVLDGAVTGSGMFVPLSPARVLDTRPAYGGSGAVAASGVKTLTMTGTGGVPATGVSGVVLNVTAVASAAGFLTVYPADVAAPNASNVNFVAGQVVPNLVSVKTSATGQVAIRNVSPGSTNVVADVAGYFTA